MKRQQFALIISVVLIVTCIPFLAHSQMGGAGGMPGMGGAGMGGMGGMGGGMGMGMGGGYGGEGGMGGMIPPKIIMYQRPVGPPPSWLTNGLASVQSTERIREALNGPVQVEKAQEKLTDLAASLPELGVAVQVDLGSQSLKDEGINIEQLKGLPAGEGPLRELLMRTLDQQELAYRVLENHIQITTKNQAKIAPTIRYYDLAFVQTDSSLLDSIMNAIQQSIDPESWTSNGGVGSMMPLGQLLVIRTTEASHIEIEGLLARLSQTAPSPTDKAPREKALPDANAAKKKPAPQADPLGVKPSVDTIPGSDDPFGDKSSKPGLNGNTKSKPPVTKPAPTANEDPFK